MDHQLAMALALLGIIGFVLWIFRPLAPLAVRIIVGAFGIFWLAVYFLMALWRSEPALWSGRAEMSVWTLVVIALGIYALVTRPRGNKTGGERSE